MKPSNLEYRMYGMVPYNLSDIQKGIQFGHAVVEYSNEYGNTEAYKRWATKDKTFIILNGGTTNTRLLPEPSPDHVGSLNNHRQTIFDKGVEFASFFEPDLGDQLTAFCFLVDERVWNREKYPDFEFDPIKIGYEGWVLDQPRQFYEWKMQLSDKENEADLIVWLRDFLRGFKLA